MSSPKNASINGGGFRFYRWEEEGQDPVDVLSVTSIRRLCGEPHMLVSWKVANVVNLAMGVRRVERVGPRGGIRQSYISDGVFPGQFVTQMIESEGAEEELARVRKWLNATADEPRDTAATRGTVVHKAIEDGTRTSDITMAHVQSEWERERSSSRPNEQDLEFVRHCVRQYWSMREDFPFVILAQEPQVWNLTAGYAGSFDVLLWTVPAGTTRDQLNAWQHAASTRTLTLEEIEEAGGDIVLGDWKTSKGVYTDHVVQVHAYLAAEFVGSDGVRDEYLTRFLHAAEKGALFHIRPNGWSIHTVDFTAPVLRAFMGSVAFARFLAQYQDPGALFTSVISGAAEGTDTIDESEGY